MSHSGELLYFFNNKWEVFTQLENVFASLLTETGNRKIMGENPLKSYKNEVKSRQLKPYFKYLSFLEELYYQIVQDEYIVIPELIVKELGDLRKLISSSHTKIRTIRTIYKDHDFFEKIEIVLDQFLKIIHTQYEKYSEYFEQEILRNNKLDIDRNPPYSIQTINYEYKAQLWVDFERITHKTIQISKTLPSWLKFTSDFSQFLTVIKKIEKMDENNQVQIQKILEIEDLKTHSTLGNKKFLIEWIYLLRNSKVITAVDSGFKIEKEEKKKMKLRLQEKINLLLSQKASDILKLIPIEGESIHFPENFRFQNNYSPLLLDLLSNKQEFLTSEYYGDFRKINEELQSFGNIIFSVLDELETWITKITPYLLPMNQVIDPFKKVITKLRGEINRQLDDFEIYAVSVQKDNNKMELEKLLDDQVKKLNNLLINYQNQIDPVIKSNIPELTSLETQIQVFTSDLAEINKDVQDIFQNFQDKPVDINFFIEKWEDKYQEIINRTNFSVKSTLGLIFNRFNQILHQEQVFIDKFKKSSVESGLPKFFSSEFLSQERYSEQDLRNRIKYLDNKILEFEDIKSSYLSEKEKYLTYLEEMLKADGLESKKCIICYKAVNVASDNFIKCEFCGSLSHYVCNVWWLNKFNSCPMCHHKYTIPNNSIYDPNSMVE
jgi:hypothetical protein